MITKMRKKFLLQRGITPDILARSKIMKDFNSLTVTFAGPSREGAKMRQSKLMNGTDAVQCKRFFYLFRGF